MPARRVWHAWSLEERCAVVFGSQCVLLATLLRARTHPAAPKPRGVFTPQTEAVQHPWPSFSASIRRLALEAAPCTTAGTRACDQACSWCMARAEKSCRSKHNQGYHVFEEQATAHGTVCLASRHAEQPMRESRSHRRGTQEARWTIIGPAHASYDAIEQSTTQPMRCWRDILMGGWVSPN